MEGESTKKRQKYWKAEVHNHDSRTERFRNRRGRLRKKDSMTKEERAEERKVGDKMP